MQQLSAIHEAKGEGGGMPAVGFELLIIILLVLANGLFATAEIAVVSARKARLQQSAQEGNAQTRTALELAHALCAFAAKPTTAMP